MTEDGRAYALPPEDLASILIGGWRLADRYRKIVAACFTDNSCLGPGNCHAESASAIKEKLLLFLEGYSTFTVFVEPNASVFSDVGMCEDCSEAAVAVWDREMRDTWGNLADYFGLPP
jgi:hypothetical protein